MKFYIIAGESSGDLYASHVVSEMIKISPEINFRGLGGKRMKKSGVDIAIDIKDLSFMGFTDVVANLLKIKNNLDFCKNDLISYQPDAVILIDYPGFNLRIAKHAKRIGLKVFYFVAPKVWAWGNFRIKNIVKYIDHLVVIFPFEVNLFKKFGINVYYFGNPLFNIIDYQITRKSFNNKIAIFPGSRIQEIKRHLPVMKQFILKYSDYDFLIPTTDLTHVFCVNILKDITNVTIVNNNSHYVLENVNYAIIASGTATLEAALYNVPQIVCYKTDLLTFYLAKLLLKIQWISLVNIILEKQLIVELIQSDFNIKRLSEEFNNLLNNSFSNDILKGYNDLHKHMKHSDVFNKAAHLILRES